MDTRKLRLEASLRHPSRSGSGQTWFSRVRKLFKNAPASASDLINDFFKSRKVRMNISDHWMKVTGFASIDVAAFQFNHIAGWAVAGVLMLILEKQVSTDA